MSIKCLCHKNVVTLPKNANVKDALHLMKENNVGTIVIVHDPKNDPTPCGIVTDRDIAMYIFTQDEDIKSLPIENIMNRNVLSVKQEQGIKEVIEKMCEKGVRRTLVLNEEKKVVGIVSIDDLMILIADELNSVSELIKKQIL